jgi:hypothetical protein
MRKAATFLAMATLALLCVVGLCLAVIALAQIDALAQVPAEPATPKRTPATTDWLPASPSVPELERCHATRAGPVLAVHEDGAATLDGRAVMPVQVSRDLAMLRERHGLLHDRPFSDVVVLAASESLPGAKLEPWLAAIAESKGYVRIEALGRRAESSSLDTVPPVAPKGCARALTIDPNATPATRFPTWGALLREADTGAGPVAVALQGE